MDTNLALLIDFENIAAGTEKERLGRFDINAVMSRLVDKGRILIARSYADWGRFSRFKQSLLAANVTMYELTSHGMQDKNRADIAMVVDALDLAFTKDYIDTFVIVSGDSDFTPLALKMRELNKRVIGIGTRSSTSRLLVNACDEFIFYDSIVKAKSRSRSRTTDRRSKDGKKSRRQWAYDLLVDSLSGLQRENPQAPLASVVKNAMRRKSPDFSESELGYSSFARFLEEAAENGYVSIERDRKAGGYRVDSVDAVAAVADSGSDDDDGNGDSEWVDTYLPKGVDVWIDALADQGLHPLSYPARMQVLQLIEDAANERASKRRKVNIQFLREDVRKRLRKTYPDMPSRIIRGIFTALMQAGLLIHKDGTAIRSTSAAFHLEHDAEGLNSSLLSLYLASLEEANADLHDVDKLSELFLGDRNRRRDVETALAWLAQSQLGPGDEAALNDIDLDDLLVLEDSSDAGKKAPTEKKADKPAAKKAEEPKAEAPKKAEEPGKKVDEPEKKAETPKKTEAKKAEEKPADEDAEEKPKRKRRTTRRKKTTSTADAEKAEKADAKPAAKADDEDDEAPRKRTRRRVRKKTDDDGDDADPNDLDLDALLSSD
jgi:uncharacterized protein (TIGR00288 family)